MNSLILSLVTFILLGISIVISSAFPSVSIYADFMSVLILILWFISTVRSNKIPFLSNVYFCLSILMTICVSIVLEFGIYLTETQQITYITGLPTRAGMQVFLLFFGLFYTYSYISKKIKEINFFKFDKFSIFFVEKIFLVMVLSCFLTLITIFLIYGFPFLMNLHRQNYWASYAPGWGATIVNAIIQFNLGLGYLYCKNNKKLYLYLMFISIFILFAAGVRFTGVITTLLLFFTPFIILNKDIVKFFNKKVIAVTMLIISFVIIGINLGFENLDGITTSERFLTRVSLQPQMWWIIDINSSIYLRDFYLSLDHYFGLSDDQKSVGPYYFMYQFAPTYVAESLFETGSTFTSIGIFNNVYFFGYFFGGFLNFLYGVILAFFAWLFVSSVKSQNLIVVLLTFRLLYTMQIMVISGTNYQMFSMKYFLFLLLILFLIILSLRRIR